MTRMNCERMALALDAFVAGELDAETQTVVEAHLEECSLCREELRWAEVTRASLGRWRESTPGAPQALRRRVAQDRRHDGFRVMGWSTSVAVAAAAAALAFVLIVSNEGGDDRAAATANYADLHVAALDRAEARLATPRAEEAGEWLSSCLGGDPWVPLSAPPGYELVGARIDMARGEPLACLEYQSIADERSMSVYIPEVAPRDAATLPVLATVGDREIRCGPRAGYSIASWQTRSKVFVAVGQFPDEAIVAFAGMID